jgi:hypothetical protein
MPFDKSSRLDLGYHKSLEGIRIPSTGPKLVTVPALPCPMKQGVIGESCQTVLPSKHPTTQ